MASLLVSVCPDLSDGHGGGESDLKWAGEAKKAHTVSLEIISSKDKAYVSVDGTPVSVS